jgi:hypothetical protein
MRERLTRITGKWTAMAVASITAVSVLAVPGAALGADMHPSDADLGYEYNPDTQEIGFWFDLGDAEVDCAWTETAGDESVPDDAEEAESHCIVLDIAGPNGQVNHGTVVSAFVHGLKDLIEATGYEGPRGQLISQVARGDAGKGDHQMKPSDDEDGDGHGPPAWVREKKANRQNKGHGKDR